MSSSPGEHVESEYIDRPDYLGAFCKSIQNCDWLALDTEFIREKSYYPKLCLLQIGVPGRTACIDPLSIGDLSPILDILYDSSVVKVLHACSQDLEIFAHLSGVVPAPIFDTQLAAPLLGLPEQIGYANFVREMLGLTLDKAQARTDWAHRPLSAAQLKYAADDVRYLAEIYPAITRRLQDLGRLDWLKTEFESYQSLERYRHLPGDAWKRIRGIEKIPTRALSILQLLAEWREQIAQDKDLPRNWVIKDDALLDIARLAPEQPEKLLKIRSLQQKSVERYGKQILGLIKEGKQRQAEPLPDWKKRSKPTAQEEALADLLHAQLRLLADKQQINNTVLASRKELIALAQGDEDIAILQGWRREMAGAELLAMRDGQRIVSVEKEQVVVSARPESENI
jgi:ribonuclease D